MHETIPVSVHSPVFNNKFGEKQLLFLEQAIQAIERYTITGPFSIALDRSRIGECPVAEMVEGSKALGVVYRRYGFVI